MKEKKNEVGSFTRELKKRNNVRSGVRQKHFLKKKKEGIHARDPSGKRNYWRKSEDGQQVDRGQLRKKLSWLRQ